MKDLPRIRKYPRAKFLDYSEGNFFVTVCTRNMIHYFGEIRNDEMVLSEIGKVLVDNIESTSSHFNDVAILNYVVMPNHLHLIVSIDKPKDTTITPATNLGRLNQLARISVATGEDVALTTHSNNRLGVVIGSMKAAVSRYANKHKIPFRWHRNFHDHFIRNLREDNFIWNYIDTNIANWASDCYHDAHNDE